MASSRSRPAAEPARRRPGETRGRGVRTVSLDVLCSMDRGYGRPRPMRLPEEPKIRRLGREYRKLPGDQAPVDVRPCTNDAGSQTTLTGPNPA